MVGGSGAKIGSTQLRGIWHEIVENKFFYQTTVHYSDVRKPYEILE